MAAQVLKQPLVVDLPLFLSLHLAQPTVMTSPSPGLENTASNPCPFPAPRRDESIDYMPTLRLQWTACSLRYLSFRISASVYVSIGVKSDGRLRADMSSEFEKTVARLTIICRRTF